MFVQNKYHILSLMYYVMLLPSLMYEATSFMLSFCDSYTVTLIVLLNIHTFCPSNLKLWCCMQDPYLVLAGPTRAVMFALNPAIIEVDLQIKGATESEDEQLSFLVSPLRRFATRYSHLFNCSYTSKLSTLEFKLGHIAFSVEATIFVRVVRGSWPDCYRGQFNAFTTGFTDRCPMPVGNKLSTGTSRETILLLDSGGEKLPVDGNSKIKFSRRVVSVECVGKVTIKVNVLEGETEIVEKAASFDALEAGKSVDWIDVTFCKMEVTVFWSTISCYPM